MKRILLLLLVAGPALAADYATVTVLDSATNITSALTGTATYRTYLVENGGSAAVYCSRNPSVTTSNGHKVGGNDGFRSFPNDGGPLYCIAAASQSGTARDRVIVWGSVQ